MKKIVCLSAASALIAALAIGVGAANEKQIVLKTSDDTPAAGETFTVTIAVENFEDFNTAMFYDVEYNEEYLEWTGGQWLLGEGTLSDYIMESRDSGSGEQGRSGVFYTEDGVINGTQDIAEMTFKVLRESDEPQTVGCSVILKNGTVDYGSTEMETEVTPGKEEPAVNYEFGQTAQIKLIEPWGLKANARVKNVSVDYDSLYDFGAYFIRASELDKQGLTQNTITAEDILNDADTVKYSKNDTDHVSITMISGNKNMSVIYDKELYTYEFSDSIFVMFYMVTKEGAKPVYAPIRERNLSELVNDRMGDTSGSYSDKEKAVYAYMAELEKNITDYRSDFSVLTSPVMQEVFTLGEYQIEGTLAETSPYTYGHTVQIKLIEPWGMKLNGRINNATVDYSLLKEYGVIVLMDNSDTEYTASELLARGDAYVFSSKNGGASIATLSGNKNITVEFFKDIYTYQLDSNVHVMFYVVDGAGKIHCGPDKIRNLKDLMTARSAPDATGYTDKEKAVYASMVGLYDTVTDYRSDYIN